MTPKDPLRTRKSAEDYVTVAQAVEEYPWLTLRYLRRLIAEHRIPVSRVGRRVLVARGDIDDLVAGGRSDAR